jgi:hypothetical protein
MNATFHIEIEIFTTVGIQVEVFWVVTGCNFVVRYQRCPPPPPPGGGGGVLKPTGAGRGGVKGEH